MKLNFPFFKKKKVNPPASKSRTIIDVKVSQISRNLALSNDHLQHIYVPIFKRLEVLLLEINEHDKLEVILDGLVEMMAYRRGKTLPSGIIAEQIQRYREISSFSLTISVLSRVIAHTHAQYAIECEQHGYQRFHNPLFTNQIKAESNVVGVVKAQHAVIGGRTERFFAQWIAHDFLSNCPTGLSWYSSFPDMLALLMECTNGSETGLLGQISDKYVDVILQSLAKTNTSEAANSQSVGKAVVTVSNETTKPAPSDATGNKKVNSGGGVDFLNKMLKAESEGSEENKATNDMVQMLASAKSVNPKQSNSTATETNSSSPKELDERSSKQTDAKTSPPAPTTSSSAAMSNLLKMMSSADSSSSESGSGKIENSDSEFKKDSDSIPNNNALTEYFNKLKSNFLCEVRIVDKDDQQLLAIPTKTNREIIVALFKPLGTEARKQAEEALMVELKKIAFDRDAQGPRLKSYSTAQGERVHLLAVSAEIDDLTALVKERYTVNEW